MSAKIKASDRADRADRADPVDFPDTWRWDEIQKDYLAVHERRWKRLLAEGGRDASEWEEWRLPAVKRGARLLQLILTTFMFEDVPLVRDYVVMYLLNRDFSYPEGNMIQSEDEMLWIADEQRKELRP